MITLKPASEDDEPFLRRVFASSRADEMAIVPWSEEEKEAFLAMQFAAQRADYSARFPDSEESIVLVDGEPVGRFWVGRGEDEIRLLDIAILPEGRNAGTGSALMRGLQEEAAEAGLPLRHAVYRYNVEALRFYERLGFVIVEDAGIHLFMEWLPAE